MSGRFAAFIIWAVLGVLFIGLGLYVFHSKRSKPFGFWANAETVLIEDVKGYHRALGILWCVYGALFVLIGLPLLSVRYQALIMLSVLGVMFISIGAMIVYTVGIEPKYRKKK